MPIYISSTLAMIFEDRQDSIYRLVNITATAFIVVFCIVWLISLYFIKALDKRTKIHFLKIVMCELLSSLAIFLGNMYNGNDNPHAKALLIISNILEFTMGYLTWAVFIDYLLFVLKKHGIKLDFLRPVIYGIVLVCFASLIANVFYGYYYTISDEPRYYRGEYFWVTQLGGIIFTVLSLVLVLIFNKRLNKKEFLSFIEYFIFPTIAMIVQMRFYGYAYLNLGVFLSIVFLFFSMLREQTIVYNAYQKELNEKKQQLFISQIQPHFIFNVLTTIMILCDEDPKRAKQTIAYFAEYLRGNIDYLSDNKPIPFKKEISNIAAYLNIEKERLGDKLNYEFNIKNDNFYIPPLLIQPLVENSVKHGIFDKDGNGKIIINSDVVDGIVKIKVIDDGVGFDASSLDSLRDANGTSHVGMSNVINRVREDLKGEIEFKSEVGKGTEVDIEFPAINGQTTQEAHYENTRCRR